MLVPYELQRQENIKRNELKLAELGLVDDIKQIVSESLEVGKGKARPARRAAERPTEPVRRSSRSAAARAANVIKMQAATTPVLPTKRRASGGSVVGSTSAIKPSTAPLDDQWRDYMVPELTKNGFLAEKCHGFGVWSKIANTAWPPLTVASQEDDIAQVAVTTIHNVLDSWMAEAPDHMPPGLIMKKLVTNLAGSTFASFTC